MKATLVFTQELVVVIKVVAVVVDFPRPRAINDGNGNRPSPQGTSMPSKYHFGETHPHNAT